MAGGAPPLAEPPITGGRVEELMGALIRRLVHSPLSRPRTAVTLSALGLLVLAVVGLTAPSATTLNSRLPLTALAHAAGAPGLGSTTAYVLTYVAISLECLGLAGMLWANSRGWSPDPRRTLLVATGVVAAIVTMTPVGSSDTASYAAYGRIAALGHDPYTFTPQDLGGHYATLVSAAWKNTPSVYGPVATWIQQLAAMIGGPHAWVTIWMLMIFNAVVFLAVGWLLLHTAADPVRACLMWAASPVLIQQLVAGGHLDTFTAALAVVAVLLFRRGSTFWHDAAVGVAIGVACAIKVNAVFIGLGIAVQLINERSWRRLVRTGAVALAAVALLYWATYGLHALHQLLGASGMVQTPSLWSVFDAAARPLIGDAATRTVTGVLWPPLLLALAWYLYNRLSPDVPRVVVATCALTFAWVVVAPWSLSWYTAVAWVMLALLPRNPLTRWLTLATAALALLHSNGGHVSP